MVWPAKTGMLKSNLRTKFDVASLNSSENRDRKKRLEANHASIDSRSSKSASATVGAAA